MNEVHLKRVCSRLPLPLLGVALLFAGSCSKTKINNNSSNPPAQSPKGGGILVTDANTYLSVNYNEGLHEIKAGELSLSKAKWVRGFIDFFYHFDEQNLNTSPRIIEYLKLNDQAYKIILNLKFNFRGRGFPAVNSAQWNNYLAFLAQVLDKIAIKTDVIVVGNEPFIESETTDHNEPLNTFYKAAALKVHEYLVNKGISCPIFIGAFDNMYQDRRQTSVGVDNLLSFCKATEWLAGVDMHIHHTNNNEITEAMTYVNDRIRADQKIILSEYSLMKWWRDHLDQDLSAAFIQAATANPNDKILPPPVGITKCWQYIDFALKNPRSVEEWTAFHQHTPWLESRKDYMCSSYKLFKSFSKFWVAAYGVRQNFPLSADFTANTDPWILNSLFTARTVELLPNGEAQGRYAFLEQFADINTNNSTCY
jgi:hypothetical protein